jgi:hypothetical protein
VLCPEDPGTLYLENGLFDLPLENVAAAFGGIDELLEIYDELVEGTLRFGTGMIVGLAKCLKCWNILP